MPTNELSEALGWYKFADHIKLPVWPEANASCGYPDVAPGQMKPIAVVHHIMQGYASTMINWAKNPGVQKSAHFIIDREGNITQTVSIYTPAWHAGSTNSPSWSLYKGGNCNKYTVGIELTGFSIQPAYGYDYLYSDSTPWPTAMVKAATKVTSWVMQQTGMIPSVDTLIGHYEIDSVNRASDPAPATARHLWPRDKMLAELRGEPDDPVDIRKAQEEAVSDLNTGKDELILAQQKLSQASDLIQAALDDAD